jgi:hypothetical protein
MKMTAYLVDVGILLSDDDKEYDNYAIVYDKCHGYYDENQFYTKTKEEAIKYVKDYIKRGVDGINAYGVVSETNIIYDYDFENDDIGEESYHPADVVYSLAKINGEIKENFVIK